MLRLACLSGGRFALLASCLDRALIAATAHAEVHGITNEDVAGKPGTKETLEAFWEFVTSCLGPDDLPVLVAHNLYGFDIRVLQSEVTDGKRNALICQLVRGTCWTLSRARRGFGPKVRGRCIRWGARHGLPVFLHFSDSDSPARV